MVLLLLYAGDCDSTETTPKNNCKNVCICLLVVVSLALVIPISAIIATSSVCSFSQSLTLGLDNDTVLLSNLVSPFCLGQVSISQVQKEGDTLHDILVYLVDPHSVVTGDTQLIFNSATIYQSDASSETGLVDYVYLIEDSVINYTICVGSEGSRSMQDGKLFVFDNVDSYNSYEMTPTLGDVLSVDSSAISIGTNNHSKCTSLHYQVLRPSYYFISSRTQGDIFYTFNYTINARYYEMVQYIRKCMITTVDAQQSCSLAVPLSVTTLSVIAHIVPAEDVTYPQTHLYLASGRRGSPFTGMNAAFGVMLAILVLSFVIIIACLFNFCKQTDRDERRCFFTEQKSYS